MTGADSPVIAASLTEATPSITSPSDRNVVAGLDQHDIADLQAGARDHAIALVTAVAAGEQLGLAFGAGLLQRFRLRLAAPFGDGFGKVGEQHREPQPEDDLEGEAQIASARDDVRA